MLEFVWSRGLESFDDAGFIRKTVFVQEQGFKNEFDDTDRTCLHLTAYFGGRPVAAARLYGGGGVYHIGRVAVLKEYRGRHFGAELMKELIRKSRELGASSVELGAQKQAEGFYSTLGFTAKGGLYLDEGCPHVMMEMKF